MHPPPPPAAGRTLGIGHQRDDAQAGNGAGEGNKLCRIGHLRQQRGRHETADLDLAHARCGFGGDPRLLGFQR